MEDAISDIRTNGSKKVGVVLSSGGGRGVFAHTGFLQALEQFNLDTVALAGCSAGALVGGIYASGTALSVWEQTLASVKSHDFWTPDGWFTFLWQMIVRRGRGYTGLSGSEAAIKFIRRQLAVQSFEDCKIPFHCLAMNLSEGRKVIFNAGKLAPRIMASAAMPVLYRPVDINGELFSDGAVISLAPTEAICCQHNLGVLIVHHTSVHRRGREDLCRAMQQHWSLLEIVYSQLYNERPWYLTGEPISFHRCRCGCGALVVVLEPDLPELAWPLSDGGAAVQSSARQQALASLISHQSKWHDAGSVKKELLTEMEY